jgi:hypothetical protein
MSLPSSKNRGASASAAALAAVLAVAMLGACSTPPSKGQEGEMNAMVQDGMRVGDALHRLQTVGFGCASGLGVDRRIDCARNVANLTQTCVEHVGFVALSNEDTVSAFAVGQAQCSRGIPDEARNVPHSVDHIASTRTGIAL